MEKVQKKHVRANESKKTNEHDDDIKALCNYEHDVTEHVCRRFRHEVG